MLAALIRYAKLVTLLLEKGAPYGLRDNSGHLVSDYISGAFAEQAAVRYKKVMKSRPPRSTERQQQMQKHLADLTSLATQYGTKAIGTVVFQRDRSFVKVFKLIAKVDTGRPITRQSTRLTAYIACRNSIKPQMMAVSGWTATKRRDILDGSRYTQVVMHLARELDFKLEKSCYDTPGAGSHPENFGRVDAVSLAARPTSEPSDLSSSHTVRSSWQRTGSRISCSSRL